MTDFRESGEAAPIESIDQLVDEFHQAGKPRDRWTIGTEYEKLAVDPRTGRAVGFSGARGIETLLRELAERFGWEPQEESGRTIALRRARASITLEPGGQVELSGEPYRTLHETREELATHVHELATVGGELGIAFVGLGMQPVSTLDEIEWVPKQRYAIMRDYMPRVGTLGHRMMKQTATVQANIDYADEADAMRKLRIGMATAPIINAIFANSCISENRLNGQLSYRGYIWTDTDRARCGLLPFAFRPGASFRDYVDWALDVPLYFVLRGGRYRTEVTGVPFRRFLDTGLDGQRATLDDWRLHLTTLFPEVRLKSYIELRSADSQPPGRVLGLPALVKGVFYEPDCLDAADDLVKRWSFSDCRSLYADVTRSGMKARLKGIPVLELARELCSIAEEGLRRQAVLDGEGRDERLYLEPVRELLSAGRAPAQVIAERWSGPWKEQIPPLVADSGFPATP
ncbi:MAG TPA: glutamate--cysteine ligase [Candidatus Binatia bacterium]|nr:glutamate--cysteine ligase [Candidatus Binatia bacterium]